MRPRPSSLLALLLAAGLAACGDREAPAPSAGGAPSSSPGGASTGSASGASSPWALPADPGQAVSVVEAKAAAPKDEVLVVGRVREVYKGRAGFTLTDVSVKYCGQSEAEDDNCPTPWDYCCHEEEADEKTIGVRVRDRNGRTVQVERLPELRNLDLVVVRGRLVREGPDVMVDATGWFRRERPPLEWDITWPE